MLHVIQDSFSPSHACRVVIVNGQRKVAALKDVLNYSEQKESDHANLDAYPSWLKRIVKGEAHTYDNDPVTVGKWLIAAVDAELDWDKDVRPYLESTVFASITTESPQFQTPCMGLDELK